MRVRTWLLILAVLLCLPWLVVAQGLTPAQYDLLKQDITVTHAAEFQASLDIASYQPIADAYNLLAVPDFYVWKTALTRREVYETRVVDAPPTQTTWNWATFKGQTVQERESWVEMLHDGVINPSLDQVRANYNTIFGGQGASALQQNFLLALSRRKALRGEMLFANTGSGTGAPGTPAILTYEGKVTYNDINHAVTGAILW